MSSNALMNTLCSLWVIGMGIFILVELRFHRILQERIARSTPATATITQVGQPRYLKRSRDREFIIELTLKVTPPDGDPYEAKVNWGMKPATKSQLQVGSIVRVKIDADDRRLIYSDESWAKNGYVNRPASAAETPR